MTELQRSEVAHLNAAHGRAYVQDHERCVRAAALGGSLPYDVIDSQAFERLCFHLLLARGASPRFWGQRGVAQHGIDLIVSEGRGTTVYQCKHHAAFSARDLENAVRKFELDWLSRPDLVRPEKFVLCTTAPLKETVAWGEAKQRLSSELGIAIDEWHRETLDHWLRSEPGIVADVFGDRVAESFCRLGDEWDLGLFQPIERGVDRLRIDRYLELIEAGKLARDPRHQQAVFEVFSRSSVVLLEGRAGAGKTMAALDLALAYPASAGRVFYLRAEEIESLDRGIAGIKGRGFRPSIFVIDDAHVAFEKVERLVDRAASIPNAKFVLTGRVPPTGMDMLNPTGTDFVARLREESRTIEIAVDELRVSAIVGNTRPGWIDPPIDKLTALSAQDLAILDLILEAVEPDDIEDAGTLNALFPRILRLIFGAHSVSAPELKRLAAVAQFDVAVPRAVFPEEFETPRNAIAVDRFVVSCGAPSALAFRHPSAAELMFRMLAQAHGEVDADTACAVDCTEVLLACAQQRGRAYVVEDLLPRLLRARLNLVDDRKTKCALLADPRIVELVLDERTPLPCLGLATFLCGENLPAYTARLAERLEALAANPEAPPERIGSVGMLLRTLQVVDVGSHAELERRIGAPAMVRLALARCDLMAFLGILEASSASLATALIDTITEDDLAQLADRSVERQASIGALYHKLRALEERSVPEHRGRTQADLVLSRLGVEPLSRLIRASGDLMAFIKILAHSPRGFAASLLSAISEDDLAGLAKRTIDREVSIDTIGVGLAALREQEMPERESGTQADLFLSRLGAEPMAQLIMARGDLITFAKILECSPARFAPPLLKLLDEDDVSRLAERTVERKGSVGTLGIILRELGNRTLPEEEGRTHADLFTERLGAESMARLVAQRGDLTALLKVLEYCPERFSEALLAGLTNEDMARITQRTVERKGGIGPFGLTLRELGTRSLSREEGGTQADLFADRLGADSLVRVLMACGDLPALLRILAQLPERLAGAVLIAITGDDVTRLVERTLDRGSRIGTLNLALNTLAQRPLLEAENRTQRDLFEERLDNSAVWRLVLGAGNLNHLSYLLEGLSAGYRARMLAPEAAPDVDSWVALARRGSFYDPARFARDSLGQLPEATADRVRLAIEAVALDLAQTSSWGAIGSGLVALEAVADSRIGTALRDGAYARLGDVLPDDLRFEGYVDAVDGISTLWSHRPELRPQLGLELWRLLPNEDQWPHTYELFLGAHRLLTIARAVDVVETDALRTLKAFSRLKHQVALEPRAARYHALYLWNLFALWYERGRARNNSFAHLQSAATWKRFVHVVKKRQTWRRSEDKLSTLMLAGTLAVLVPELRRALVPLVRGQIKGIQHLAGLADRTLSAIPAILVCHGLALSVSPRSIFTPDRVCRLLRKTDDYEDRGPALNYLCGTLGPPSAFEGLKDFQCR